MTHSEISDLAFKISFTIPILIFLWAYINHFCKWYDCPINPQQHLTQKVREAERLAARKLRDSYPSVNPDLFDAIEKDYDAKRARVDELEKV